jgi:hypothetical protein
MPCDSLSQERRTAQVELAWRGLTITVGSPQNTFCRVQVEPCQTERRVEGPGTEGGGAASR